MKVSQVQIARLPLIFLLTAWICLIARPAEAETAYVTDFFEITLRTGPNTENKVLSVISTGEPVEILETREGWSYIRLVDEENKKEGWVLNRFLVDRLPWKTQFQSVQEENNRLREQTASYQNKLEEALRREKNTSSQVTAMQANMQQVVDENQRLKSSQRHTWFGIGALVLLCGWLIGFVIGRRQRSRRFY
ncbi:MAG: TIGR04211 family SH3 domain-containing protein [Thermodesulfobacteriota bacterium]